MCFEQLDRDECKSVFGEEAKRVTLLEINTLQSLWVSVLSSSRAKHFTFQKSKLNNLLYI
jgi:hypothetical protein